MQRSPNLWYNTQVHSSTGFTPFELVLSPPPQTSIMSTHYSKEELARAVTIGEVDQLRLDFSGDFDVW
jgi:hypothetical protein